MTTETPSGAAVEFLGTVVLFRTLPPDVLAALAATTVEREYPAGTTIIERSEPGDGLYVVLSGLVQVGGCDDGNGAEPILAVLGPGEAFGELSLLDGKPRSATVIAAWQARCLFLPRESFLAHMDAHPETARALLQVLVTRLREMDRRLTQRS